MALPLVTVIVRSMGRPELPQALASIAAQTWRNIEVVVVDARGTREIDVPREFPLPLRVGGLGRRLWRPAAANAGVDAAQGDFITLLDEDDFIEPPHIEALLAPLLADPAAQVSYSGIRVHRNEGEAWTLHLAYSADLFLDRNYICMGAMLVARSLAQRCRFDESFEMHEDWDYVIQRSAKARFRGVAAVTMHGGAGRGDWGSGEGRNRDQDRLARAERKLKNKGSARIAAVQGEVGGLPAGAHACEAEGDRQGAE